VGNHNKKTNNVKFVATSTGGLVQGNTADEREVTLKTKTEPVTPDVGFAKASPNFKEIVATKVEASEDDKKASLKKNVVANVELVPETDNQPVAESNDESGI
jgi:hypothetical protein